MSARSELELVEPISTQIMDDAQDLQEHELVLDLEEAELLEHTGTQHVRAAPPPPPPPRRSDLRVAPFGGRSRNPSGVFPIAEVEQALAAAAQVASPPGVTAADAEISRLKAQLRARDAYVIEVERVLDEWTRQLSAAGIESAADLARLLGRSRGHAYRASELEGQVGQLSAENAELRAALARDPQKDSPLRRVRGIGMRYARQLEALGVVSVEQIAGWSEQDVVRFAGQLRIAPSRIARELWIEQARCLVEAGEQA